jgi:hypothetical protein
MVWLFDRSLVGGVQYITHIPLFWLDDVIMTSSASWWRHHDVISIAKWLLTIWHSYVASNHWQSGANYCWIDSAFLRSFIAKYMLAILATSYRLNRNDRVSSFWWTRGSKQCFSHVSLILVATFSIFTKLLLTNVLELVHCTCTPMFLEQNAWVFQSKTLVGTWW